MGEPQSVPSKHVTWWISPFSILLNVVPEISDRAPRQGNKLNGIQIVKEGIKVSLVADDVILYLKDSQYPTLSTKVHLEQRNKMQNQSAKLFPCFPINQQWACQTKNQENSSIHGSFQKGTAPRDNPNKGGHWPLQCKFQNTERGNRRHWKILLSWWHFSPLSFCLSPWSFLKE